MNRLQARKTPTDTIRDAQIAAEELKLTPQSTSAASGVQTYQVPAGDNWDLELNLPVAVGSNLGTVEVTTAYDSEFQDHPVFYPYLIADINGHEWHPVYSPNLGLGFRSDPARGSYIQSFEYLQDKTVYSEERATHRYITAIYYRSSIPATLRLKFKVRSTDRGTTSVQARVL